MVVIHVMNGLEISLELFEIGTVHFLRVLFTRSLFKDVGVSVSLRIEKVLFAVSLSDPQSMVGINGL